MISYLLSGQCDILLASKMFMEICVICVTCSRICAGLDTLLCLSGHAGDVADDSSDFF